MMNFIKMLLTAMRAWPVQKPKVVQPIIKTSKGDEVGKSKVREITIKEYFGEKPHTAEQLENAIALLAKVNGLLHEAQDVGKVLLRTNPDTACLISGQTEGGFRSSTSTTGSPGSAHREGRAVDVYDPANLLDNWITRNILVAHGLYREAAPFTKGWLHISDRAPGSGNRSFIP